MSVNHWTGGDWLAWEGLPPWRKGARKVPDWLWLLVPIVLFLVLLVILGLKFLRDFEPGCAHLSGGRKWQRAD
jgi:hypothetical protein